MSHAAGELCYVALPHSITRSNLRAVEKAKGRGLLRRDARRIQQSQEHFRFDSGGDDPKLSPIEQFGFEHDLRTAELNREAAPD